VTLLWRSDLLFGSGAVSAPASNPDLSSYNPLLPPTAEGDLFFSGILHYAEITWRMTGSGDQMWLQFKPLQAGTGQ
jgi:hypothetical protein